MHNRIDLTRPAAPELARRGPFAVGVRTLALVNRGQVDVFGAAGARADRELVVELWYPAAAEGPGARPTRRCCATGIGGRCCTGGPAAMRRRRTGSFRW